MLPLVDADGYRSYVIRVRRRSGSGPDPGAGPATRLDVEDLLDGGRATLSGDPARTLAERLELLVDGSQPPPAAGPPNDPAAGHPPPEDLPSP